MSRIRLACAAGLGTAALLSGGLVAATTTAFAAPGDTAACPAAFPAGDLTLGQEVTGLTTAGSYRRAGVERDSSTTPEEFTGRYRGSIEDPSGDLLVFELEGSRITHADGSLDAGIWAGMSGSPVLAADGRLIGAVSYSFSGTFGSTFAGVTPAADLYALLGDDATDTPARIQLSDTEQTRLRRQGLPAAAAKQGLHRLAPPTTLAGMQGARRATLNRIAKRFEMPAPTLAGGALNASAADTPVPIEPGSNFAVADSFGTVSLFGVGTTTAVCNDQAIAFGHPADWAPSTKSVHGASTTVIQGDGASSYKIANLAAPAGTLVADHLAGIVGILGTVPPTTTVRSTATGTKSRQSNTRVPNQDALAYVAANQVYLDTLLALDQAAGGSATLTWRITYQRAGGKTGTFTRSNMYADRYFLGEAAVADVAADIDAIVNNPFEKATVTDVRITEDAAPDYRALKVGRVEIRKGGSWTLLPRRGLAPLRPGTTMKVRVNLVPTDRTSTSDRISRVFSIKIPRNATGSGQLRINGNAADPDDFYDMPANPLRARNFPAMLAVLKGQARQNDVVLTLRHPVRGGEQKRRTVVQKWRTPAVTFGHFEAGLGEPGRRPPLPR